ncbi:ARM repeat-containing protein [Peniophora sp. CONT]|nr:ARM repeat-containing protein [Peniophora sp. CONT]
MASRTLLNQERSSPTSIWAPRPQPTDVWNNNVFNEDHQRRLSDPATQQQQNQPSQFPQPQQIQQPLPPKRSVGAIGDGRRPSAGGDADSHVASLLRALDLHSPAPPPQLAPLQPTAPYLPLKVNTSPDLSPCSAASSLLTPSDSPARATTDFSLKPPFDYEFMSSSSSSNGLMLNGGGDPFRSNDLFLQHQSANLPSSFSSLQHQHQLSLQQSRMQNGFHSAPTSSTFNPATLDVFGSTAGSAMLNSDIRSHTSSSFSGVRSPTTTMFSEGRVSAPASAYPDACMPSSMYAAGQMPLMADRPDRLSQLEPMRRIDRIPISTSGDWLRQDAVFRDRVSGLAADEPQMRQQAVPQAQAQAQHMFSPVPTSPSQPTNNHEPINFLSLLHPSSSPPYALFVSRIIKSSDQQASIFLQQKLKVADTDERAKIIDAICARGFDMMAHRFGNWAVQRCLEAASTLDERRKIVTCMRGRVVELAMNCYGCHVLQKALDCEEEVRLIIVSELLLGDPAQTLVNKHASHVWSKIMELTWTAPAPPIFAYVNASLQGKWAALACHETGSLVVQHAFENLEEAAKDGIVDELLNQGPIVFAEVAKNQWGAYCVQHILEHGSPKHRQMALEHLISGLLDFATNEQGSKSVTKALKEGGKDTLNRVVKRMSEPAKGGRRAIIVDLALSVTGSQLIAAVLPGIDKEQRTVLYDAIRGHIVTLRGCKTGSKVIWLFDRMRAYYGY